ncbi:MAG: hypothetical protein P4L80_16710 [Xanthobacteraceae bacterium]|nr:hypothetical protein [Xanthobacteraceae bacterium]
MTDSTLLKADAREMASILRTAKCVRRHSAVSFDLLAEMLTALCTGGALAGRNAKGYDVSSPEYGRIEVKSRTLGTDGPFPRVSLSPNKMDGADWFMAVRWTEDGELHAAVMLPKTSVAPLFDRRLQARGTVAHIRWDNWQSGNGRVDLTERFREALRGCGDTPAEPARLASA